MKVLIFDSGPLITLSMNCLLNILPELKKNFDGKFIITKDVEKEIITKPLTIKKYELEAIRLRKLVEDKVLEFPESLGIKESEINRFTNDYLKKANSIYSSKRDFIHIIDLGEASVLALSNILAEKGIENMIAVDERTTRVLCERPDNLKNILERKLHTKIKQTGEMEKKFSKIKFIRSTELIYVAFRKGIIENQSKEMIDALLYSAKFKGASISSDEIKELKKLPV